MIDMDSLKKNRHTWLITGVSGFIGSNLLETLLKLDQKVVGLDNHYTGCYDNITAALKHIPAEKQKNFTFHQGDISKKSACQKAMQGIDFVLHQAALSSIPKSLKEIELTHKINTDGFFNILLTAQETDVKRVIYASSCAIYGNKNPLPSVETQSVDILSPYNATKYINEVYAQTFSTCYGLETIGLRYFNVYGPRQEAHGPYASVITRWIGELLEKKPTYIHDDHDQTRDFCYIEDVIRANILAATTTNEAALNTIYNIASSEETNLHVVYDLILKALDMTGPQPIAEPAGQGELMHSLADTSKAKKLLGYTPQFTIKEGIPKLVAAILGEQ
ncbi:MAG: NAD-dependent epimerase/dehydratase family protein [Gammaproteobacteria bacterium]|nr:NAD-dependent epimerase/dehydratase family protein [Gammaproteobacteria bacterium]